MKKLTLTFMITLIVAGLLHGKGYAYTTVSAFEAHEMLLSNEELIVVDVREEASEYCYGHIPCAIVLPWNSGVFSEEYSTVLPINAPILVVCRSGNRSGQASAVLSRNGYETVYNLADGMSGWTYDTVTCEDIESCDSCTRCDMTYPIYFPHIATGDGWETEITIINTSPDSPLSGTFKTYSAGGELLDNTQTLNLPAAGRTELIIGDSFQNPTSICYIIFVADNSSVYSYLKFYNSPGSSYRVAIPAPTSVNQNDIAVSHIALTDGWWTGLALVNTTNESRTLTFTFNNSQSKNLTLAAGAYQAIIMADFLADLTPTEINSAIISNADGIVGLEIFGNGSQLSGVLLRDATTQSLYYPHVVNDQTWWTGIVAFNPGLVAGELVIKPYSAEGTLLSPADPATPVENVMLIYPAAAATPIEIGARERFMGSAAQLNLPAGTDWLAIETTVPVSGFELFGTANGLQLAGYTSVGIDGYAGVFPKQEDQGWSSVALVNTTADPITVTLNAYRNDGNLVSTVNLPLNGHQRIAGPPEDFFSEDINNATYIAYNATAPVVAFQLNGSGSMLDALPGRQ